MKINLILEILYKGSCILQHQATPEDWDVLTSSYNEYELLNYVRGLALAATDTGCYTDDLENYTISWKLQPQNI